MSTKKFARNDFVKTFQCTGSTSCPNSNTLDPFDFRSDSNNFSHSHQRSYKSFKRQTVVLQKPNHTTPSRSFPMARRSRITMHRTQRSLENEIELR